MLDLVTEGLAHSACHWVALTDGVVSFRKLLDEVAVRHLSCLYNLLSSRSWMTVGDVFVDRPTEQDGILWDHADTRTP